MLGIIIKYYITSTKYKWKCMSYEHSRENKKESIEVIWAEDR